MRLGGGRKEEKTPKSLFDASSGSQSLLSCFYAIRQELQLMVNTYIGPYNHDPKSDAAHSTGAFITN